MFLTNMLRKVLLCSNKFQCIVHYMPLWKKVHYHPKLLLGKVFNMCVCACVRVLMNLQKGSSMNSLCILLFYVPFCPLLLGQEHNTVFTGKILSHLKNLCENVVFPVTSALVHTISFHFSFSKMAVFISFYLLCHHWIEHCLSRLVTSVV